jgi:hypothetical protein
MRPQPLDLAIQREQKGRNALTSQVVQHPNMAAAPGFDNPKGAKKAEKCRAAKCGDIRFRYASARRRVLALTVNGEPGIIEATADRFEFYRPAEKRWMIRVRNA